LTLRESLALVVCHIESTGLHTEQSVERLAIDMGLFVVRLELLGVNALSEVDRDVAQAYVDEAVRKGSRDAPAWADPSVQTQHFRRGAVRLLFRVGRSLGLCDHDPTMDIVLPPRTRQSARPLSDDEVFEAELAAQHSLTLTRLPAAWALAEASGVTSEIAAATVGDLDLPNSRVWLHGCNRRVERWADLTQWGVRALAARVLDLGETSPATPLVYRSQLSRKSGQAATCDAIHDVLGRAGLASEADVRPASVIAWKGVRVFACTQSIEHTAQSLGLRSLDQTARLIGHRWDLG
jgi:integrase/recombinase XerC